MLMYATNEFGEVRIIVWRSMLASDSGEMDRALFLLSLGVSLGLENRDTARHTGESTSKCIHTKCSLFLTLWRGNRNFGVALP